MKTASGPRGGTGGLAQRQLAQMKAHMIARHKLATVKGRPEEMELPGSGLGVSISYGCRQVRVRLMEGREWLAVADFQPGRPWRDRLNKITDPHFGFQGVPTTVMGTSGSATPVELSGDYDRAVAS